jgi:hypothetical protein
MRKRQRTKNGKGNKYDLTTPIVKAYLDYISTPENLLCGQKKHLKKFMAENQIAEYHSLQNYEKIPGFREEVIRRKNEYEANERLRLVEIAKAGLEKRAVGMKITNEVLYYGKPKEVKQELPPDPFSCVSIHKIYGNYEEKVKIEGLASAIVEAAKKE